MCVCEKETLTCLPFPVGAHISLCVLYIQHLCVCVLCPVWFWPIELVFLSGRQARVIASGVSWRNAALLWVRRNMKETLNQDTEPHESCQRLSWRRGMGPSVAAYEWLTDSQCCWHKLKKCEEVVKISAVARHIAWKPASVKNEQTQIRRMLHSSPWRFTE